MKRLFFILLLMPVALWARKTDVPAFPCIYSFQSQYEIESVKHVDAFTAISMSLAAEPHSKFQISASAYLSDEAGMRHPLIKADGIVPGETQWAGEDGKATFTLYFDPLPEGTKVFDIIEGEEHTKFKVFGIHKKGTKLRFTDFEEAVDSDETAEKWFVADTAVVRVRLSDYSRQTMPHIARLEYHDSHYMKSSHRMDKLAKVRPDGTFEFSFRMDFPNWTYISLDLQRNIPFYVRPGDTLNIQVDNYGQWNEKISHANSAGRPTYSQLQTVPFHAFWPDLMFLERSQNDEAFAAGLRDIEAKASVFFSYISHKHQLSSWENHLLMSTFRQRCAEIADRFRFNSRHRMNMALQKQGITIPDRAPDTELHVAGLDWSDKSLLYCDNWSPSLVPKSSPLYKFAEVFKQKQTGEPYVETFPTYRVANAQLQALIDSIVGRSEARYTQVLMTTLQQTDWSRRYIQRFIDVAADFEGPDMHFVLLVSAGDNETELQRFKAQVEIDCKFSYSDMDVVVIGEEDIINLQEALHSYLLPGQATITKAGEVFRRPLSTQGDDSRIFFRGLLARDKKNETTKE